MLPKPRPPTPRRGRLSGDTPSLLPLGARGRPLPRAQTASFWRSATSFTCAADAAAGVLATTRPSRAICKGAPIAAKIGWEADLGGASAGRQWESPYLEN